MALPIARKMRAGGGDMNPSGAAVPVGSRTTQRLDGGGCDCSPEDRHVLSGVTCSTSGDGGAVAIHSAHPVGSVVGITRYFPPASRTFSMIDPTSSVGRTATHATIGPPGFTVTSGFVSRSRYGAVSSN